MYIPLEVISNPPGKGLLKSMDHNSPDKWKKKNKIKIAVLCLFIHLSELTSVITNSQYKTKNTPRMHRNHVPLNCTDGTIAHIPSHTDESCISLPTITSSQSWLPLSLRWDCSWFGCGTGRGQGLVVCKRKRWQVESSTVILTFPLISSSVVPVLSGLSVFVGAVQCQLTWPSKS